MVKRLQDLPGIALVRPPQFVHAFLHLFEMDETFPTPQDRATIKRAQSVPVPTDPRGQESTATAGAESGEYPIQSLHVVGLQKFPVADHVDDTVTDAGQGFRPLGFIEPPPAFLQFVGIITMAELDMVKQKLVRPQFQPIEVQQDLPGLFEVFPLQGGSYRFADSSGVGIQPRLQGHVDLINDPLEMAS